MMAKAIARSGLDGFDGAHSLSKIWCCCTASTAFCLMSGSGALPPCQTSTIFFHNFSALLIRCSSFSCKAINIPPSSALHGVVCVSDMISPTRSNSLSSVCTRCSSCSVDTPPFNHKKDFEARQFLPDSVTKCESQT